jgi:nucleoside-diphosphate-sugar epimerase
VLAELSSRPDVELLCVARSSDAIPAFPTVALDIAHGGGLQLERLLRRFAPTVVVNCAGAIAGDLEAMAAANIGLVGTLVDSIASSGVDARIVHIGSSAEYGPGTPGTPVSEKDVPRPTSPYAVTKLAGTKTVLRASGSQQPGAVVLRVFNPVGPGSSSASLTGRVLAELDRVRHEGGPLRLGPLGAARDFVDVRDVATATARAALLPGDLNGIVNVGGGRAVPVRRFVQALCREAQFDGEIVEDRPPSDRSAHVDWQCADITRAGTMLGWHPAFDLADSVRDILASRVPS